MSEINIRVEVDSITCSTLVKQFKDISSVNTQSDSGWECESIFLSKRFVLNDKGFSWCHSVKNCDNCTMGHLCNSFKSEEVSKDSFINAIVKVFPKVN